MKKGKLSLGELQVKSFVTNYESEKSETVKGGISNGPMCGTQNPEFCNWTNNDWCWDSNETECQTASAAVKCKSLFCATDLWCTAPK